MKRELSAGAVIFRKERSTILYLLLHYESGYWDFVKGHIENKESVEETIKREAKEEAGLEDLEFLAGFKETIKYTFFWPARRSFNAGGPPQDPKQEKIFKIVTFRLAETKTKEIKLSYEHIGYDWLEFNQALETLTHKNAREVLIKADEFLRKGV